MLFIDYFHDQLIYWLFSKLSYNLVVNEYEMSKKINTHHIFSEPKVTSSDYFFD